MKKTSPEYFNNKWTKVIKSMPNGGEYDFAKRQHGYNIVKSAVPDNSHVFDYACGLGVIDLQLEAEKNCICSGVDMSSVAIQYISERSKHKDNWKVSDNFYGFGYDVCLGIYIIEHLKDPVSWMSTALKIAKKCIVVIPNNFRQSGEHIYMQWNDWKSFYDLFKMFNIKRLDIGKYPKGLTSEFCHPIFEFYANS